MRLTAKAITQISNLQTRLAIATRIPCSETWVRELIKANKDNGPLTTYAVLDTIKQETGLKDEEILEEVETPATSTR